MKVLVITIVHVPLDARIHARQLAALLEAGAEVTYAAPFTDTGTAPADVHRGLRTVDLPRSVGRSRFGAIRAARALLRREGPRHDLVLLHDPELLLAVAGTRRTLPPVVWDVHEDVAASLTDRAWVPRALVPVLRVAVRVAQRTAERTTHLLLAEWSYRSLFRHDHPVVPNVPSVGPSPGPLDGTRLVYVGRVSRSRGALTLLALPSLLPKGVEVDVVGPLDADVSEAFSAAAARGELRVHGFVPNDRARRTVEGALAGLSLLEDHPNHRDCLQSKLLEYLERGVPVIATDLRVPGAFVRDMAVGAVVPTGDAHAVADVVARWMAVPEEREAAAARGRALVVGGMNWDVEAARFVQHLRRWAAP